MLDGAKRRLAIFINWLFKEKFDVTCCDIIYFLFRPSGRRMALSNIVSIEESGDMLKVTLKKIQDVLYWPKKFNAKSLHLIIGETFDPHDWHYYEHPMTPVGPDDIVLDIGAAEGLFSLSIVNRCKNIFLIEPNPSFNASLHMTFARYLQSGNVKILNYALGSSEGTIRLTDNGGSSMVSERGIACTMLTADNLFTRMKKIDFIKADVEGFELEILKGARMIIMKHQPKIAITCYHPGNNYEEIIRFVKEIVPDYTVYRKGITSAARPQPMMLHFYKKISINT
jgi:FkbM family methyltransferase